MAWKAWRIASMYRPLMNTASGKMKNKIVNKMFASWTHSRGDLNFSDKTFNQLWKERHKK
jgi:L-lactate dehydrogenase complex protein LldF